MNAMTDNETYNGYANRETWAFNLHWQNDQGLYNETLSEARHYIEATYGKGAPQFLTEDEKVAAFFGAGEHVVTYWRDQIDSYEEDMGSPLPEGLKMFDREVGSWWRIDYSEVGAAVRESLDNES